MFCQGFVKERLMRNFRLSIDVWHEKRRIKLPRGAGERENHDKSTRYAVCIYAALNQSAP